MLFVVIKKAQLAASAKRTIKKEGREKKTRVQSLLSHSVFVIPLNFPW